MPTSWKMDIAGMSAIVLYINMYCMCEVSVCKTFVWLTIVLLYSVLFYSIATLLMN